MIALILFIVCFPYINSKNRINYSFITNFIRYSVSYFYSHLKVNGFLRKKVILCLDDHYDSIKYLNLILD